MSSNKYWSLIFFIILVLSTPLHGTGKEASISAKPEIAFAERNQSVEIILNIHIRANENNTRMRVEVYNLMDLDFSIFGGEKSLDKSSKLDEAIPIKLFT